MDAQHATQHATRLLNQNTVSGKHTNRLPDRHQDAFAVVSYSRTPAVDVGMWGWIKFRLVLYYNIPETNETNETEPTAESRTQKVQRNDLFIAILRVPGFASFVPRVSHVSHASKLLLCIFATAHYSIVIIVIAIVWPQRLRHEDRLHWQRTRWMR